MVRIASLLAGICVIVIGFLVGPSVATFSGKNGLITFARFDGKHVEIFSANPDGSDIRKLAESKPRNAVSFISDWSRTVS